MTINNFPHRKKKSLRYSEHLRLMQIMQLLEYFGISFIQVEKSNEDDKHYTKKF